MFGSLRTSKFLNSNNTGLHNVMEQEQGKGIEMIRKS